MDKELKNDIKKILFFDSLLSCTCSISKILDDIEDELDEICGKPKKCHFEIEDLFKIKDCK